MVGCQDLGRRGDGGASQAIAMLQKLWKSRLEVAPAEQLYLTVVAQARQPVFYADLGVPDTPLGRFEMIALHAYLVFRRLRGGGREARALAQAVHDVMFNDMDRSLREMGVGDLGVGKRVKKLATNLYGRIAAYDEGMDAGDDQVVAAALARNVFVDAAGDTAAGQTRLAQYMRAQAAYLATQSVAAIGAGQVGFADAGDTVAPA